MSGRSCQLVRRNSVHTGKLFRLFTRLPLLSRTCAHCTGGCRNRPPPPLSYAYDFIHVKCYVNRGLFSQRIYNYSAAAYFAAVYLAPPATLVFFINFVQLAQHIRDAYHIYFMEFLLWEGSRILPRCFSFSEGVKNIYHGADKSPQNQPSELPVFIAVSFPSHAPPLSLRSS